MKTEIDEQRERDIQSVCAGVIKMNINYAGDSGAWCPFCWRDCAWNANDVSDIEHEPNCIVLIAKDLLTQQT